MNVQMKTFSNIFVRDQVDWELLYREHMPKIYNYFLYRIGNDMQAEDLTAVTFEKAWRARKSYQHQKAAFTTWLYTIARNTMADHYRKVHDEMNLDTAAQESSENEEPEYRLISKQTAEHLVRMLSGYSPRERDLIALKYGAELNNRQIAKLTGLSESNVGTILHRIVTKLRNRMEQNHE